MSENTRFELSNLHEYMRLTGNLAMQWFFFACTVNAAIAAMLLQNWFSGPPKCLPMLMTACDLALAIGYATLLPWYYLTSHARMAKLTPEGSKIPFPACMWCALALALTCTFASMAAAWYFLGPKAYVARA